MQYKQLNESQFKVYPYRHVVTVLFSFVQLMTSVLLATTNPIADYLTEIYGESNTVVSLGGLLFVLMHPIFTFPAAYVIDTYGSKVGISVGCVLGIIGVSLRLLVNQGFAWVIVGQVLAGIGRPFILNCQGKIAANWYTSAVRGKITQILTLVLNVSLIIGVIIPTVVFGSYKNRIEQDKLNDYAQGKKLTFDLMLLHAIMGYICYGVNLIFQRNKPPTPPSQSQKIQRDPFTVAIKKMLRNSNYIKLMIAFGCFFGIFNGLSITLAFMLKPWFPNTSTATAFVGGSPIISGIIGVAIIGPMQRKSMQYKKWIMICMCGSLFAIALFYPMLQTDSLVCASLISAFNSFWLIPLVPIMLELGCQLVFPVGEGTAVGCLFAMGNFAGFLLGTILSIIVKGNSKAQTGGGLGFCFGIFLIGLLMVYLIKQDLRRSFTQKSQPQNSQTIISYYRNQEQKKEAKQNTQKSPLNINQTEYEPPSLNTTQEQNN